MLHSGYESDVAIGGEAKHSLVSRVLERTVFLNSFLERSLSVARSSLSSRFDQWFVCKELVPYQSVFMCQSSLKGFHIEAADVTELQ